MTDRLMGVLVTFDKDIRDDDAAPILAAIRQLRHVIKVAPVLGSIEEVITEARVRQQLGEQLWNVLNPK